MQAIFDYIKKEWASLSAAPLAFVGLAVVCLGTASYVGYRAADWYYAKQIRDKDSQISRYRVALNIDKASPSILIELNNEELRAKAENTVGVIRGICLEFQKKDQVLAKQFDEQGLPKNRRDELWLAMATEIVGKFNRDAKSDFINLDEELRRRLGPSGINPLGLVSPELPFNITALTPGPFGSLYICNYADELDQMAKRLPSDSAKP
jgi:hypothetical protein